MSSDTKARQPKPPEKRIGPFAGGIGVAIWLNEATEEDGSVRHFRSLTVNPRRYLDKKSGQWKDAASFQPSDLPALLFCLAKAQEYCYETPVPGQEDAETPGLEDETGGRFWLLALRADPQANSLGDQFRSEAPGATLAGLDPAATK